MLAHRPWVKSPGTHACFCGLKTHLYNMWLILRCHREPCLHSWAVPCQSLWRRRRKLSAIPSRPQSAWACCYARGKTLKLHSSFIFTVPKIELCTKKETVTWWSSWLDQQLLTPRKVSNKLTGAFFTAALPLSQHQHQNNTLLHLQSAHEARFLHRGTNSSASSEGGVAEEILGKPGDSKRRR